MDKNKPPDKFMDYFKSIKVPLKHIIKNPDINIPKITEAVIKCNKIVINALMFMKLYLLDHYEKNNNLPIIDKVFVNSCMKILCKENPSGRPPKPEVKKIKDELTLFYNSDYKPLIKDTDLDYTHLNTVLDYLTISIITMYENNIKQHYVEYVERYVNIVWKKKETLTKIKDENKDEEKRKQLTHEFCNDLRKIKNDILDITVKKYKSDAKYHKWIKAAKKKYYQIKKNTQKIIYIMIYHVNHKIIYNV